MNQTKPRLTDEELRVRVAELMGLRDVVPGHGAWYGYDAQGNAVPIPDYPHDLNAMADAERTLSDEEEMTFCRNLSSIAIVDAQGSSRMGSPLLCISATARQRAEAFAITQEGALTRLKRARPA